MREIPMRIAIGVAFVALGTLISMPARSQDTPPTKPCDLTQKTSPEDSYPCQARDLTPDELKQAEIKLGYFTQKTAEELIDLAKPWIPSGYVVSSVEVGGGDYATISLTGHATQRVCDDAGISDTATVTLQLKDNKVDGFYSVRGCDEPE